MYLHCTQHLSYSATQLLPEGSSRGEVALCPRPDARNGAVDAPFLVRAADRRQTKATARSESKPYLALELADKTGMVAGRVWSDTLQFVEDALVKDTVVRVQGTTQDYNGEISLVITDATPVPDADFGDYVPTSPRDRPTMRREYESLVATVGNVELANLLQTWVASPEFAEFCAAPASASDTYSYLGGLLEHTLSVAQMALALATARADIDTDLLLTAALLHEIGKTGSFNAVSFAPDNESNCSIQPRSPSCGSMCTSSMQGSSATRRGGCSTTQSPRTSHAATDKPCRKRKKR